MAVLQRGKLKVSGRVDNILNQHDQVIISSDNLERTLAYLQQLTQVQNLKHNKNELVLTLSPDFTTADLNRALFAQGIVLSQLTVRKKSLESQFMDIVRN